MSKCFGQENGEAAVSNLPKMTFKKTHKIIIPGTTVHNSLLLFAVFLYNHNKINRFIVLNFVLPFYQNYSKRWKTAKLKGDFKLFSINHIDIS